MLKRVMGYIVLWVGHLRIELMLDFVMGERSEPAHEHWCQVQPFIHINLSSLVGWLFIFSESLIIFYVMTS